MIIDQHRWDNYAFRRLEQLRDTPKRFLRDKCPSDSPSVLELIDRLGELTGKRILELGCGFGDMSVWLAKSGAVATGVDLGPNLVKAADKLASLNSVHCDFRVADITELREGQFDAIIGLAILHHLSEKQVKHTLANCYEMLAPGGAAYFIEPVENSRAFDFIQNLIPLGGTQPRPSILNRKAWKRYVDALDDRAMTDNELVAAGSGFDVSLKHFGLTVRLNRILGASASRALSSLDEWLLGRFAFMRNYSQSVLATYTKSA